MRRTGTAVLLLAGCVAAGLVTAFAVAGKAPAGLLDTSTTTTTATTSTSTSSTTSTTTTTAVIADDVSVGGVPVGGMTPADAYAAVRASFEEPLIILLGSWRFSVSPERLGARAYALRAVDRALAAAPGTAVPLQIAVDGRKVRSYVAALARRFDREPADAQLFLRRLRPWIAKERPGRTLLRTAAVRAIVAALAANRKGPLRLRAETRRPKVTRRSFGPVIVIHRGSNRLHLYRGMRLWRVFGVATGQSAYPTPLGRFAIVVKWRNPWWYPPDSPWAQGSTPIPPGPGNPLGTRWMGLSAPGVGIHGTPDAASIGYSVSHGCIRMHIPDAEWLFEHVRIGTTVFIVAA